MKKLRLSIRELLLLVVIASLGIALLRVTMVESESVYLHVFGTVVSPSHDRDRPDDSPTSYTGVPWTRVATVHVYDQRTFGMFTPNNRQPSIAVDGKLQQTLRGTYRGTIHFWLDDSNLTWDLSQTVDIPLDQVVYIDEAYNCYVLSRSEDPYRAIADALDDHDPQSQGGG